MDFDKLTYDELDQHTMEQLVLEEDEISPILRGHLIIEKVLETLLSKNFERPSSFFRERSSFKLKVDLAYSLGLINNKYKSAFLALNNIRNNYAHKHNYRVSLDELSGLKFDWTKKQNLAFDVACLKGAGEAAKISTVFLCWKAILLIKKSNT